MLFNSYFFICIFLPITLIGFFAIGQRGHHRIAVSWLVGASLFFYGWWNPAYLWLILGSILFNYTTGIILGNQEQEGAKKGVLVVGISINLATLGYFKYANFFVNNLNSAIGSDFHVNTMILPLAISFFTFQQITYLVDAYKGETREYNFLHYSLFVTFFPQLIAGPIVHHKEMLPQFVKDGVYRLKHENLAVGITVFAIGLFKKVCLADGIAQYATPVFQAAEAGVSVSFIEAWGGALAYTFQLYFDFSGYSDMAIGLACMFGIQLPLNFNSPYKAINIIEFWSRWHMTLSRFFRDYLYVPLGGNRKGKIRQLSNLMITMLLGGLWHGAGWTFVMWGGLHGAYLVVNHIWHAVQQGLGCDLKKTTMFGRVTARLITFTAVVVSWVFFRAETFDGAMNILRGMSGQQDVVLRASYLGYLNMIGNLGDYLVSQGVVFGAPVLFGGLHQMVFLIFLSFLVWVAPNTQQIMFANTPEFEKYSGEMKERPNGYIVWKASTKYAIVTAGILFWSIWNLSKQSEFLYFNF